MPEWLFTIAFVAVMLAVFAVGLLTVVLPPETLRRALAPVWIIPVSRRRSEDIQRRVAGIFFALIGLYGLISVVRSMLGPSQPITPPPHPGVTPMHELKSPWLAFAIGASLFVGGFYFLLNPRPVVQWSARTFSPEKAVPGETLRVWRFGTRITGALMLYGSQTVLTAWWSAL